MVSPKVSLPATPASAPRHRSHSLAPDHLGEAGGAATLVLAIGGLAIFIAAIGVTIAGLTLPGRYGEAPAPPNIGSLGILQVGGGITLLVLGLLIVASAAALLANLPRSRVLAIGLSALAALLAAVAVVVLAGANRKDPELIAAMAVSLIAFGGAAIVLGRARR